MQKKIDSHQHFWKVSRGDYHWLTPALAPLYRDFLPDELEPLLKKCHIDGTILVQAASTMEETFFMLQLAEQYPFILGVVGSLEMEANEVEEKIETLSMHQKFCGIRPMLQDMSDINWMLKENLAPAFKALQHFDLTFDALVYPKHLPNLILLVERYPDLKIVIDHGAKPFIAANEFEPWASNMKELASHANVYCKFSGLLNEAGEQASFESMKLYIDHLFSSFGTKRLMWGSDYPVLNLFGDYVAWYNACYDYVSRLGEQAITDVFGNVAAHFYGIKN